MVTAEQFARFLAQHGYPKGNHSFYGKPSCPRGGMVRYPTSSGEAVKHLKYRRGKLVRTTYELPAGWKE